MDANIRRYAWPVLMMAAIFLSACSGEEVGPSKDKVKLDLQDWLNARVRYTNLVHIDDVKINKRVVLAEDRVNFDLTVTISVDEKAVDRAIEAFWERQRIIRSYQDPPDKAQLMALDGGQDRLDVRYTLSAGGLWQLSGITTSASRK